MIDCVLVGYNDSDFGNYVEMVRSMGTESGAYRDLNLAFIQHENKVYRGMDILSHFYHEDKGPDHWPFSNVDFMWPVVAYLGNYLHRRGHTYDYVRLFHLEKEKLKDLLTSGEVRTVAITTTVYVSPHPIIEVISFIREHNEEVKIIVGGPYVSSQVRTMDDDGIERLFDYLGADYYVINSEGEQALVNLLDVLKEGGDLAKIDNIAYREGGRYVRTPESNEAIPLEEDLVDYSIFPREDIGEFLSLRTAKSCPFSCAFCGFPQRAGKYRYLNVDQVEQLLSHVNDLGTVSTVTFLDDTFNVPKKRFKELLRMMIRNRYDFKWNSFYRSDHGDEEAIDLMAEAGCEGVFLGAESGSDTILQKMNKTARTKDYLAAIPRLKSVGILTHANFIIGFPGENERTVQETMAFIEEAQPDTFKAQLWYADPITPIWNQREEYRISEAGFNWEHATMDFHAASDWIDTYFLKIENSLWLPQWGFEQWSMFYLQRKGMPLDRVKNFMKTFNACVREKLLTGEEGEVNPDLLKSLRTLSQFDQPTAQPEGSNGDPVDLYAARDYREAEQFWSEEFRAVEEATVLDFAEGDGQSGSDGWSLAPLSSDDSLRALLQQSPESLQAMLPAILSVLLSKLSGREDMSFLWIQPEAGEEAETLTLPLHCQPQWDLGFGEYLGILENKLAQAMEYRTHARYIAKNQPWLAAVDAKSPRPEVGIVLWQEEFQEFERSVLARPNPFAEETEGLALILEAAQDGDRQVFRWRFRESHLNSETIAALNHYLDLILADVTQNGALAIGEMGARENRSEVATTELGDQAEAFQF